MKKVKVSRLFIAVCILCTFTLTLMGCTKQDMKECPSEIVVDVRIVGVEGEDITDQGAIKDLSLYVFDNNRLFLKQLDTHVGESLQLYFPDQDTIHVVSWGNLSQERLQLPSLVVGTPMHEAVILLKDSSQHTAGTKAIVSRSIAMIPDDLFYSSDEISLKTGVQTSYVVKMSRTVSSMAITIRNLQSYANRYDENYSLVVRETYNGIDFYGRLTGDKVGYIPTTFFNDKKELTPPVFHLLPSHEEGVIEIDIYHEDELITTVKNDNNGQPLKAPRGQTLNVEVDFKSTVSVVVSVTPWGVIEIPKEY